ncbi:MAG: TraR/DksA C4-type zinc finger protein [Candidatus Paceibacterota bacterium]|jgi:RNA polymerase-binding transcription factor DksA
MLTHEKQEMLKGRLIEERAHLEQQVRELETPPDFGDVPGPEDDADENVAALNQEASARALKEKLGNIEGALLKMEKGTYGTCEMCGGQIDEKVLVVVPDARRCQVCNQKMHVHHE